MNPPKASCPTSRAAVEIPEAQAKEPSAPVGTGKDREQQTRGMLTGYGKVTETAANANVRLAELHRRALSELTPASALDGAVRVLDAGSSDGANSVGWVLEFAFALRKRVRLGGTAQLTVCGFSLEEPSRYVLAEALVERLAFQALEEVPESERQPFVQGLLLDPRVQSFISTQHPCSAAPQSAFAEQHARAVTAIRDALSGIRLKIAYCRGSFYREKDWLAAVELTGGTLHAVHTATADHWLDPAQNLPTSGCQANLASQTGGKPAARKAWQQSQRRFLELVRTHLREDGFVVSGGLIEHAGRFPADAIYEDLEAELAVRGVSVDFQSYFPTIEERTRVVEQAGLRAHSTELHIQPDAYSSGRRTTSLSKGRQHEVAANIRKVGESWSRWKVEQGHHVATGRELRAAEVDAIYRCVERRLLTRVEKGADELAHGIAPYHYCLALLSKGRPTLG